MIEEVRTEDLPEIVDTLNEVIDWVNTAEDKEQYSDVHSIGVLPSEADTTDIVETLNRLIIALKGGV